MDYTAEMILAVGGALSVIVIALAIANNINRAQAIELYAPYYAVRSSQYPSLES